MKSYLMSFLIVLATHITSLLILDGRGGSFLSLIGFTLVIQVAVNTILHFVFCVNGNVAPFALPLMWGGCILPLYIYCYGFNIIRSSSFLGRGIELYILGLFGLLPVVLVSMLTACVFYLIRLFQKR